MTVPVPDQLEYISDADGTTTDFPYPTRFLQKDEIVVVLRDADGIDTPQYLNQHFTIAGGSWPNGGIVSFYNAPAAGLKVVRTRMTQAKQTVDLENRQRNDAPSVELQLDRTVMAIQDTRRSVSKLEAMSDEIGLAQGYAEQAAEARDSARDAREDAERAAERNWFAFETRDQVALTIVPSSTHYIRTAGESMRGDGKGGLYIDEPNGTANTVDSLDGRTWYKVVDVQSERVLHTPKISRMIPRSLKTIADGLPLSPLDFGARGMDALRDADGIQSALQFLADFVGDSDATLDCGGKRFLLNRAIAPTSASGFYRKRITNGFFRVASSFPADTYMFDLSGLGNTGNQISRIRIDNNFFVGAAPGGAVPRAYGWIKLNYTLGNDIHDNVMEFLTGRGIWDENTRAGAGNYIRDNRMFGSDTPGNYITGIRVAGYDNKIYNNMLAEFSEHIRCEKGANVISGNHVYNFRRGNTEGPGISTGREENSNETLIQGNYIDTVRIDVYNPENTTITGNKFLIPNISYWAERPETAFIELVSTQTTGTHYVDGLQIIGNQFKSSYGVAEAIRARTAGAALIIRDDVFIKDNIFMRVNKRAAQASITKEGLAAVTSTTIDLSSFKIPSVSNDHLNMVACAAQGTGGSVTNLTRSNDVYTVNFSSPFTGKVTLSATMCANGAW